MPRLANASRCCLWSFLLCAIPARRISAMSMVRRCVLLAALMYWVGGFTFYAAAVVPIGSEVLGSHLSQGRITRRVAVHLNLAASVAIVLWAWDIASAADALRW